MENAQIKKIFYLTNSPSKRGWLYNLTDGTRLRPIKTYSSFLENGVSRRGSKFIFEQGKLYLLKDVDVEKQNDLFLVFRVTRRRRVDIAYFERREGKYVFCFPTDDGPPVLMSPYKLERYFDEYCSTLPPNSKVNALNFAKYLCSSGYLSKYLKIAKPTYHFF